MKLWQYLKKHIIRHSEKIAIANSKIKYKELLNFEKNKNKEIQICEGKSKEEQALNIIRGIAQNNCIVPIDKKYGESNYQHIKSEIENIEDDFDDLAFIMYTSGSTGIPKGVKLTEDNIITNIKYIKTYFNVSDCNSICIGRPLVHISVITGELLYALCQGLTIYFYEEEIIPNRMLSFFNTNKIDIFCSTPTIYKLLAKNKINKSIKVGVMSGERLLKEDAQIIMNSFVNTNFYNVYGLTEHSPRVSALRPNEFKKNPCCVGKPIGDVEVKIVNNELLIRSPCIMKGYLHQNELTKQKIKEGWLYTGDIAIIDNVGNITIMGRMDNMIIHAGINVYPEEIEATVSEIKGVVDCIVYEDDNQICMIYEGEITKENLVKEMARKINCSIVPRKIQKVDKLAKTVSGKKKRYGT